MSDLVKLLKKSEVVVREKVTLTSGLVADFYVDLKRAYSDPAILKIMAAEIAKSLRKDITCVASTGYGGLPLVTAVALKRGVKLTLVREKPKRHGRGTWIDGHIPTKKDTIGLIDDVLTTGGSLLKMADILKSTGGKIVAGYVVVDRSPKKVTLQFPIKTIMRVDSLL